MKKCNKYLKRLRKLYDEFERFSILPFTEFNFEALDLLGKIKNDIDISFVNKPTIAFIKYSNTIKSKLNDIHYDKDKGLIIEIEKWFFEYNYGKIYDGWTVETILNIDQEYDIYSDLSFPMNMLRGDECDNRIYNLQSDFLAFSKAVIVKDIFNYLDSFNHIDCETQIDRIPQLDILIQLDNTITLNSTITLDNTIKLDHATQADSVSKDRVNEDKKSVPTHFKSHKAHELFEIYMKKHIIDPYPDISFLFQALNKKKLLIFDTHIEFMLWLKEANFISENVLDKFLKNRTFRSYDKTNFGHRVNNFNVLYEEIFNISN